MFMVIFGLNTVYKKTVVLNGHIGNIISLIR